LETHFENCIGMLYVCGGEKIIPIYLYDVLFNTTWYL